MFFWLKDSIIARNAYKLIPLLLLAAGLSKGLGRGKSLFNFSYAVSVQAEINDYARRIQNDSAIGEPVPAPETFGDWLRKNFHKADDVHRDQGVDLWGTPYVLRMTAEGARIISAGPDKIYDTADDLVANARLTLR